MLRIMKENVEDLRSANLWLALPSEFIGTLGESVLTTLFITMKSFFTHGEQN